MSCGCGDNTPFGGNDAYNNICNADTPYPIVSAESVPSLISNLTYALYGQIQKDVSSGKVVWIIPCDPNNTAFIGNVPRLPGEGLMCYFIRYFNTVYPNGVLGIAYGGTGATTAQTALSNLGGVPDTRQIITAPSSGLAGGGPLATDRSLSIANTTVVPGTYGAIKRIPVITVNSRGQLTQVTQVDAEGFSSVETEVITASAAQQTVFNLTTITYSPGTDNLAVYRNGLRLLLGQDYTETNSNTVTLTSGVDAGDQLLFESGRIISEDISAIAVSVERQTANAQQTVFTLLSITYFPGNNSLAVYRNGLKLSLGLDYAETNSATVTLTDAVAAGDQLTFEAGKLVSQQDPGTIVSQVITSSLDQTVFSLTTIAYTPNVGNLAVYQDGLRLISGTDYTETNSTTVTLTTPALAGRQFMFEAGYTLTQPAPVAAAAQLIAATAGQTVFALSSMTYVPNTLSLSVFRNGLRIVCGLDYTETNSNTVTLTSPATIGDQFVFEAGKILTNAVAGTSVGFQQAGTGAVTRDLQSKARESVSVLDFGAVGNGIADDTLKIQDAITAVSVNGGTVHFPVGTYLITGTLNVQANGIVLQGESTTGSKLQFNNGVLDSIYLQGLSAPGIYNCQINDLTLEHGTKTGGAAIRLYRANQCQFARLNINNCWNGFDLKTINNVIISESVVTQIKGAFGCKFWSLGDGTERADVLTIENTVFQLNNNGGDGIVWDGFAHTMRIFGVGVLSANRGILIKNTASSGSYYPSFGEFFDLEIDGTNGTSCRIEAGSVIAFNGCELFNLSTATGPILEILSDTSGSYTNAIRIANSRIFGGNREAINCAGRNIIITGSQIGGGANTGHNCININNNTQDFIISNCSIGVSWGSFISKYSHAIAIAATTYRGLITNNSFFGCLAEITNGCTTQTVVIDGFLDRNGNLALWKEANNSDFLEDRINNTASGASVTAQRRLVTGTPNSYVIEALKDNSGSPFIQTVGGPAVTGSYHDFNVQYFRNIVGTNMFSIGAPLGDYANDAAAAAGGVPQYGYYRTGTNVKQRVV
jgi:hypothetical protein